MTEHDLLLRPLLALVAGGLVGLERSFHGRAAGLRTYALVSFASALLVGVAQSLSPAPGDGNTNVARVIQGIVTGIGFLGAGVIVHHEQGKRIHGLTSAACVWLTACIGIVCGAGQWRIVLVAGLLASLVLLLGKPIERLFHRLSHHGGNDDPATSSSNDTAADQSGTGPHQPGK